jgi:threonine dehydrogenase-like Zn-dependent dehydrogenase
MPKELIGIEPRKIAWRDYEEPKLGPGDVRVKCEHAAAKHGTEMAFYKGYLNPRGSWNTELEIFNLDGSEKGGEYEVGNMFCGPVTEVGADVKDIAVGDMVFSYAGFKETQVAAQEKCFKLPDGVSWKSAMCIDPAVFAMGGVRDGNLRIGDRVSVFGLGAIGLMVVQLAKASGASKIIAVDPIKIRRDIALKTGADIALDPAACDAGREIKLATGGRGVDVAIEFSGAMPGLQHAIRSVGFGGNVVFGAFPPAYPAGLDFGAESHLNRPNLIFSRACSDPSRDHPRWSEQRIYDECYKLICEKKLVGDDVVQPVVKFGDLAEEYGRIADAPQQLVKLGVDY